MPINFRELGATSSLKRTSKSEESTSTSSSHMVSVPQGFKPAENASVNVAQKFLGSAIFSGAAKFQETAVSKSTVGVTNERSSQPQVSSDTKGVQSSPSQIETDKPKQSGTQVSNESSQPQKTKEAPTLKSAMHFLEKRMNGETSSKSGSVIPSRFRTHMGLGKSSVETLIANLPAQL